MERTPCRRLATGLCAALLAGASAAHAVDGVIEINDAAVAAAGGYPFAITASGSYVLTGNLAVPFGGNGIDVSANNVSIDLNGFQISGPLGSGNGINGLGNGLSVRNGTVSGFVVGIFAGAASQVIQVRISNNGVGIANASQCLILESRISANSTGIQATSCKIENNILQGNSGAITGADNLIVHNQIRGNGAGGILASGGTILNNVIEGNGNYGISDGLAGPPPAPPPAPPPLRLQIRGNSIQATSFGPGITTMLPAQITDNVISYNGFDGIVCGAACTVRGNVVESNNLSVYPGSGGVSVGHGSTVTDNSISFNGGFGLSLPLTSSYSQNTLMMNGPPDVLSGGPHPTSGATNLCTGVPGPAATCP